MIEKLASMQTQIRNQEKTIKTQDQKIRERDEEILNLKKQLQSQERTKAKNQSYIESKVQKEVDQINENKKRQMKGKHDNQTK
ncbi:hypothetical protein [uncultured Mediterranean phage uvMED]|jgi:hypothetical protein|nr:hypothetical protein [uncultured Mediterranean phage uvMED]